MSVYKTSKSWVIVFSSIRSHKYNMSWTWPHTVKYHFSFCKRRLSLKHCGEAEACSRLGAHATPCILWKCKCMFFTYFQCRRHCCCAVGFLPSCLLLFFSSCKLNYLQRRRRFRWIMEKTAEGKTCHRKERRSGEFSSCSLRRYDQVFCFSITGRDMRFK